MKKEFFLHAIAKLYSRIILRKISPEIRNLFRNVEKNLKKKIVRDGKKRSEYNVIARHFSKSKRV